MRIAVLVKQIPVFEELTLLPDGRLERSGLDLELNAYCRRAVSAAVAIVAERDDPDGEVIFLTLGPPAARDVLREATAWADARGVPSRAVLISDPAFAGSDTLATARALAAALHRVGPIDLVLVGRNSVDADTGQVGPELASLLDLPFVTAARRLTVVDGLAHVRAEYDDGWAQLECTLPAVISTAERLIEPCKVDPTGRAAVAEHRIETVRAADLGSGPWGQAGSPTTVGATRVLAGARARQRLSGPLDVQVRDAMALLAARGAFAEPEPPNRTVPAPEPRVSGRPRPTVAVLVEPERAASTAELLSCAARLADELDGRVVAFVPTPGTCDRDDLDLGVTLGPLGADHVVAVEGTDVEEDVAAALARWAAETLPWAILGPGTTWGREVLARTAATLGAGLTGDAIELDVDSEARLVAWKAAFGGQLVAAIRSASPVQMATVRPGALPTYRPRTHVASSERTTVSPRRRVRVLDRARDDDLDVLAGAARVVGVGLGVAPERYDELQPLLDVLDAPLAATRKVTDRGWLPRARQVGITGRSIAPRLYVAVGSSGKFNHMVGVRAAHSVLAINGDPDAPVFDASDVGIVAEWRTAVPLLVSELTHHLG